MSGMRSIVSQISHTIMSNLTRLVVVGVLTIIVPKFISVENYGYWQLYIFYTGYVGFFHLGWCDGIYLKEGGKEYKQIDKSSYKTQFYSIICMQIIFSIVLILGFSIISENIEKWYIVIGTCVNAILCIPCTMLGYILQATSRIKEYSYITIIGRLIYFLIVIVFLILGLKDYKMIILADLIGWLASSAYSLWICKDIMIAKASNIKSIIITIWDNIAIGSKLMIANIASTLIIGIVRINIEKNWDIAIFGKISLTLNLCNLVLIFINAISIVLYPMLRKVNLNNLKKYYETFDGILTYLLSFSLILYFPIKVLISYWLPQYSVSIDYMAILFPICMYESKVTLLLYTFLKVIRQEKYIMKINLSILIFSVFLSYVTTFIFKNLSLTIFLILILLLIRCIVLEIFIHYKLNVTNIKIILYEFLITVVFLGLALYSDNFLSFVIYIVFCSIAIYINRKNFLYNFSQLKKIFT